MGTMPAADRRTHEEVVATLRAAGCVFAEDEADLIRSSATTPAERDAMVAARVSGTPLEYVLGWAEFCGLRIAVGPGVFVPRRRTSFLVERAVALGGRIVVDLCCGSGAVGAALAARLSIELYAADISPTAVACARRNLPGAHVYRGDLDEPLPPSLRGRVDLLMANAPYVPTDAIELMPPEARDHEPDFALNGGADGLDIARRIAALAPGWLAPAGHLLIETSARQAPSLASSFTAAGLAAHIEESDEWEATIVIGHMLAGWVTAVK
jgi:release factor glutamine methyltransferase